MGDLRAEIWDGDFTFTEPTPSLPEVVEVLEHDGQAYVKGQDGMLFDQRTNELVGVWNPVSESINPVKEDNVDPITGAALAPVKGMTYVFAPDGTVTDGDTQE